ncbi:TonB-dependent receptor [Caldithrix abyssi]
MRFSTIKLILILMLSSGWLLAGTTGKIAGIVVDAENDTPLPGVNVYIEGTSLGAATDVSGNYYILKVPPGTYTVIFSFVGYQQVRISNVKVKIDLTTRLNVSMKPSILTSDEVIEVVATQPVVQKDVAASVKSMGSDEISALPVTNINEMVGLQAGVSSNFEIRGSGADQVMFMVDGVTLRDERSNEPMSDIPLSAVEQISVQSGGFGAEYNNVRSGVVNVVTKEGDPHRYSATFTYKISPPHKKHFGISPYDPNSYWLRPYLDPAVAWTGTEVGEPFEDQNGNGQYDAGEPFTDYNGDGERTYWDEFMRRQYPKWDGWIAFSEATLKDNNPDNDLTPEAAYQIFRWEHRKQGDIKKPDYYLDFGFGGPVPFISKKLGNLRFYASYKREQNMYLMQLSRDGVTDQSYMLKITSDISKNTKFSIIGLYSELFATTSSRTGGTEYFRTVYDVANVINTSSFTVPWRIYTNLYYSPTARYSHTISAKLTHVINPSTYFEFQLRKLGKTYHTAPGRPRDLTKKYRLFDDYYVDEAPFGFYEEAQFSIEGSLAFGGAVSTSRDYSRINTYSTRFDLVSQINNYNQLKGGAEFVLNDFDMQFGMVNKFLPEGNTWTIIKQKPYRASLYLQDKIEFEGWISTVGVILDYSNPNGKWYNVGPYDRAFYSQDYDPELEDQFKTKDTKAQLTISPRIAISHPITANSKLYFNYGHYQQVPTSERWFRVQRALNDKVDRIGDPNLDLKKTISYELGFDQAIFNDYLLHLAGYYKDVKNDELWVRYISYDGKVNYFKITTNAYEDIRGFEFDLTKMRGKWITGNINYEYRVGTSGYFGLDQYFENPAEQLEYLRQNPYQEKPRPRPRVKSTIDFHTPLAFGPKILDQYPAGDWHFNFITYWTAGEWFTWNPNRIRGIQYNVQWRDYFNVDLRISKVFPFKNIDLKFFVDISNLFNFKHFSGVSFRDQFDRDDYFKSLHLPESIAGNLGYPNIPGNDQPGDYRKTGVPFQPMQRVEDYTTLDHPNPQVIYWDAKTRKYYQFTDGDWSEVGGSRLQYILDNKAYIDMPNQTFFTFLNPRSYYIGFSINYKL